MGRRTKRAAWTITCLASYGLALVLGVILAAGPVAAGPALVFKVDDGKVLYSEDPDDQWHPASLTKIMTAYLVMQAVTSGKLALDQKLKCSAVCNEQQPSKMGLPVGAEITVDNALKTMIVKSANDLAVLLAEGISGSVEEFAGLMNATAAKLGMTRSHFVNPNGWPADEQVTTARDLGKIARAVFRDFPQFAYYWALADVQLGRRHIAGHNGLLKTLEGADGMKTGFTCDSGYNVVASASRDGQRIIAIVLGERSGFERSVRAQALLEHGFSIDGWKMLFTTTTLDNMPMAGELKPVVSVRPMVLNGSCGSASARAVAAHVRKRTRIAKAVAAAGSGAEGKQQGQAAAAATPTGAKVEAAAKPAAARAATKKPAAEGSTAN